MWTAGPVSAFKQAGFSLLRLIRGLKGACSSSRLQSKANALSGIIFANNRSVELLLCMEIDSSLSRTRSLKLVRLVHGVVCVLNARGAPRPSVVIIVEGVSLRWRFQNIDILQIQAHSGLRSSCSELKSCLIQAKIVPFIPFVRARRLQCHGLCNGRCYHVIAVVTDADGDCIAVIGNHPFLLRLSPDWSVNNTTVMMISPVPDVLIVLLSPGRVQVIVYYTVRWSIRGRMYLDLSHHYPDRPGFDDRLLGCPSASLAR